MGKFTRKHHLNNGFSLFLLHKWGNYLIH